MANICDMLLVIIQVSYLILNLVIKDYRIILWFYSFLIMKELNNCFIKSKKKERGLNFNPHLLQRKPHCLGLCWETKSTEHYHRYGFFRNYKLKSHF